MNDMEARHHRELTQRNQENADLRDRANRREAELLREREQSEANNRAALEKQADDYAKLDRWYREELEREKARHRK